MSNTDPLAHSAVPVVLPERSAAGDHPTHRPHHGDQPSPGVAEGAQIGPFRLVSVLGRGGMGTVWRAEDTVLHRPVALKFLSAASPDARERFLREARLAAGLSHPNILTVHHVGEHEGFPFIVTELVPGGSLDAVVGREGPLAPARAARLILHAARALEHAHRAHVVHRDIKPGNMLLAADGTLKVGDFGLARSLAEPGHLTTPGMVVGTPQYLAPELCSGAVGGPQGDLYALGCTFFYLLTGRRPFQAETTYEYLLKHCNEPLPDLRKLAPNVPESLVKIVNRACEKDPAYRYGSAAAMAVDLESTLADMGEGSPSSAYAAGVAALRRAGGGADKMDPAGDEWADGRPDDDHGEAPVANDPRDMTAVTEAGTGAVPIIPERDRAGVRNLGVLAGLGLAGLFVWFLLAVLQRFPADTFWENGLHPFRWSDLKGGAVTAYLFWLSFAGLAVGPMIARLGARYGKAGYVAGILLGIDVCVAASMSFWGPMPGAALAALGSIPALILIAVQGREDRGFSWFGALLLSGVGALITLAAVPDHQPLLGGLFDGRLHADGIVWWHYIAYSIVPAVFTFLPQMITGIFDVGFLRRGKLQTGLAVCFVVSIFIWGPAAGLLLPLIPLTLIGGTMAVLDIG